MHQIKDKRQASMRIGAQTPGGTMHKIRLLPDMTIGDFKVREELGRTTLEALSVWVWGD